MTSVVVLNYNASGHIGPCMRALRGEADDVVVVDNASTDGSLDEAIRAFPGVRILRNETNLGFAAAANQGIRATTSPIVVLLNHDVIVRPGAVSALARALEDRPAAAIAGALVLNPDGTVQPTKRAFPSIGQSALHGLLGLVWRNNPGTRAYTLANRGFDEAQRVDWVAAPAIAIRRDAFEAVGGFDEDFFFFVEDVDLCRRLADGGFEVWFTPEATVTHYWGGSWTQRPLRFLWLHQRNLYRYFRKHRRGWQVLVAPIVAAGLVARFTLLAFRWLITRRSVPVHRTMDE